MRKVNRRVWLWVLPVLLYAVPAAAQDERLRVSFGAAATAGSGDASPALTASAGYRFREQLLFEVDVTATESPAGRFFERPLAPSQLGGGGVRAIGPMGRRPGFMGPGPAGTVRGIFERPIGFADGPGIGADGDLGDLVVVTMGLRYELGVQGSRLQPYVGGGLGLARRDTEFTIARWLAAPVSPGHAGPAIESVSRTGMAASASIGASLRVYRAWSLDVDARYLVLDRGPNLTRLGGGVSYRF